MLRASSFALKSLVKNFASRPVCQALNSQLNVKFSTNFEGNKYSDVNDTSLFEQINPENLNKDILKSLFSAKDIEQVLTVYGANKDKINERNIALIIRNISSRTHTLYSENRQTVSRNYHLKDLMMYIKDNIENLNEPALTEILTFHRKLKNYYLAHGLTREDERRLYETLDKMIQEKQVNPKLCAHIFYEYSILRGDATVPFNFLKEMLNDPNQNTYFTPFACVLIIKGIVLMKADKRKYSDFAYRLCVHLESGVASLNTFQHTTLFSHIASLHLQNATSHKRPPQILWKLKELIEENKQSLSEEDVLNVLRGYTQAPHTLDIKLLQYLKNSVLLTISQKPLNLSLSFLIEFTAIMAEQRDGINLSSESLTMIGNELEKRFEAMPIVKLSHIVAALKAFSDSNFKHENLSACLYKKLMQIPESKYSFKKCVSVLILLMKQGFPSEEFARKVILKFKNELPQQHLEWVLKVFYICSHPNLPDTPFWNEERENIFQVIEQQCQKHPNVAIKLLGSRFSNITNTYAIRLQNWALAEIQQKWDDLDFYEKSNHALNFINSKHPENKWANFIFEKFKDLDQNDLVALLHSYELKEPKNYFMADLVFRVTNQSSEKFNVLRKIIDAIISTPPIIIMTKKGTPNDEVRKLLDELLSKPLEIDPQIKPIDLVKLNRNLKLFGVDPRFSQILTVEYLSKTDFIEQNKTNNFTLAEISELLIEVLENPSFSQEGLVHLKEKAAGFLHEIIALLNNYLETENIKNITLNLLVKIVKNFLYLHKVDPSKTDRTFTDFMMNNLFQKLRTINVAQHYSMALNATFLIIEAQILDFYKFDEKRSGQIADIFKNAVGFATPIALIDYLKNLEKYIGNPNFSSFWNSLNEIQDLYRTSTVQIYPHVILAFLSFFSKIGTRDPHFYNKVLKDIESVFEDLKPKHTGDILVSFSFLRIKHEKLFKGLSQKILDNLNFYQRELPISLISYARLGFTQDWCQNFIQKAISQIKTSNYNFEGHPLRSVECLWTIVLYNINEPQLVQKLTPIFESYVLKDDWLKNDFNKLLVNHLYSLYMHGHPSLAGLQLSQEVVSRLEGTKLARTIPISEIPDIYEILEESRISYEKNKYVEDVQIVDLFLPQQRIGVFFVSDFYVTFDGTENSGYQIMREKVLQSSKCDFKLVHIYEYHWKKLSSKADQIKYLQKLGINCKNNQ